MNAKADQLYRQAGATFAPAIARLAHAVERNPERARDLEQEMHCALWSSLARFEGKSSLKTWVYRVAHNVAADHIARSSRLPRKVPLEEIDTLPAPADPETETAESLVLDQIAGLIRRLPALDAQVIVLWLEGERSKDISEITGLSSAAVNTRIHRIKLLMASHFEAPTPQGETP